MRSSADGFAAAETSLFQTPPRSKEPECDHGARGLRLAEVRASVTCPDSRPGQRDSFRVGDYPGMIGNGNTDLRDLPLGGT